MMGTTNFSSGVGVQKNKSGHIKNLPDDILLDIMSRLPVDSVSECKLVCKMWQKILQGRRSFFRSMHISRQLHKLYRGGDADKLDMGLLFACRTSGSWNVSIFYGELYNDKIDTDDKYEFKNTLKKVRHPSMLHKMPQQYLVGSQNGLVCLNRYHHRLADPTYICNPVTREYVNLPTLAIPKGSSSFPRMARGFGYVSSTNEYKVVRIFYPGRDTTGQVQIYTLGNGCGWRTKPTPFPWVSYEVPASFVDGILYWFRDLNIYAFDLANEEMRVVSSPPCDTFALGSLVDDNFGLVVLRGNLCFFHQTLNAPHMEIWSMTKTDTGENWYKDFSIVYEKREEFNVKFYWPILVTENNKVIFTKEYETIECYDPETATWKEMVAEDPGFYIGNIFAIPHVNTYVSFRSLGEKSSKKSCRYKMIGQTVKMCREMEVPFL